MILLALSVNIYLGFIVEYWPIVGICGCLNHSKLCHSLFISLGFFSLAKDMTHSTIALPIHPIFTLALSDTAFWVSQSTHSLTFTILNILQYIIPS